MLEPSGRVGSKSWNRNPTRRSDRQSNKKLLRTLFLDSLTIERHVIISQDIVVNRVETKKNIDAKREIAKKKKENLQNDLVAKLKKKKTRLNNNKKRD